MTEPTNYTVRYEMLAGDWTSSGAGPFTREQAEVMFNDVRTHTDKRGVHVIDENGDVVLDARGASSGE